jgi:hypothetical protein
MYGLPHPAEDPKSSSTPERPSAVGNVDRPNRHRFNNHHREGGYESVTTVVHPPVTGACKLPTPPPSPNFPHNSLSFAGHRWRTSSSSSAGSGRLPKMNFPQFDTENPKLWLTRCEDYFELYDLDPVVRVKFASMNFSPTAGRWLQSVDKKLRSCSWEEFSHMLLDR